MPPQVTLQDLGERGIIAGLLHSRYGANNPNFGDDCASFRISDHEWIVATTDPCPRPMSNLLGFSDLYYWGWLLTTINLSDLAAAGARPVGLLTSLMLPPELSVDELERLLAGIDACCDSVGAKVIGGNLKEGQHIDLTATAIGICEELPMSRRGASAGDYLLIFGDLGFFWAGYFMISRKLRPSQEDYELLTRNILTPEPKVVLGAALQRAGLLHACIDNSDGLYPSLRALEQANDLGIRLDFADVSFAPAVTRVAQDVDVDPLRFVLGWGDWQLIAAARADALDAIQQLCAELDTSVNVIGKFVEGHDIILQQGEKIGRLMPLDSQRFATDSWFRTGVESYARRMLEGNLFV